MKEYKVAEKEEPNMDNAGVVLLGTTEAPDNNSGIIIVKNDCNSNQETMHTSHDNTHQNSTVDTRAEAKNKAAKENLDNGNYTTGKSGIPHKKQSEDFDWSKYDEMVSKNEQPKNSKTNDDFDWDQYDAFTSRTTESSGSAYRSETEWGIILIAIVILFAIAGFITAALS